MLRPAMNPSREEPQDVYSFVVAVAKRAREIAAEAEESHEILEEKAVRLAVEELIGKTGPNPAGWAR